MPAALLVQHVPRGRVAGTVIALCSVAGLVAIAHHPVARGHDAADALPSMIQLAAQDRFVHGALIVLLTGLTFGFTVFSLRRGLQHQAVLAGLLVFAAGVAASIAAGVLDGFIVSALAELATPATTPTVALLLRVCASAIQTLTVGGLGAVSLAILLWSSELCRTSGLCRFAGVAGIAAAALSLAALLRAGHLNPHALLAIFAAQSVWYLIVAGLLLRGRV